MHSKDIHTRILNLKKLGWSSRKIAKELGIGKSTVNDLVKRSNTPSNLKLPKILFLDIETAPSIVSTFGRFKVNISQDHVLREGGWIISYAYKWAGDKGVKGNVLSKIEALDADDSLLTMELWELLEEADVIVYHNGVNFDLPIIKTRLIVNGLPPSSKVKSIDTLQLVREFKFNSNKLDSLCKQLGIGQKIEHSGIKLWIDCMTGDENALQKMLEYNKMDVELLEQLYNAVKSYSTKHPNLAVTLGDKPRCNVCCSDNVSPTGKTVSTNVSVFEEYVCNDCQARFKSRKAINTKEQKKNYFSN